MRRLCNIRYLVAVSIIIGSFAQLVAQTADLSDEAVSADAGNIRAWALSCALERGPGIILYPDSIEVSHGTEHDATGPAGNEVVSLGDGGRATLGFEHPIIDGPGPDFAVFENSFDGNFLELAFVEVSSDGELFYRFPASSLTSVEAQIGPFGIMDPGDIHNLAGKFRSGQGTPFDLAELGDIPGLNITHITAVRIIDVIGILDESLGSRDADGRLINDPFPTPFPNGGFDLDAIGVIHSSGTTGISSGTEPFIRLTPNPFRKELFMSFPDDFSGEWMLFDLKGRILRQGSIKSKTEEIDTGDLPGGIYIFQCLSEDIQMQKRLIKH